MKMKLNQEDENRIFIKNKLVKQGGSCSWIKIQIKKKKEITKSEICQELQHLKLSLIYLQDYGDFEELSNKIMKKLKKILMRGLYFMPSPFVYIEG